ncbi:MAG TPA: efflux transporter outer membrane subunit [Verrucomicrobiae bacterium]|jgi:NodT family efflux transporter outer membrane factor (OMF) lipoprotein|nr:efflux transporter outer membrane subunit [Verrucomicrobiae bacterium]
MSKARLKAFFWISLTALALAAGCNFAPKYKAPPMATPMAFKETNGWKTAEPSDGVIKGNWWEMFGDPQLNALEDQVNVSNQTIVAALETFLAARDVAKQANSQLYPTVSAQPSATRSQISKNGGNSGLAINSNSNSITSTTTSFSSYELPLDATWEPDLWGSIRNATAASTYAAQASAAQLENMRLTMQAELAVDFYDLRFQDELIALYNSTITNYRASLDLTKTLFETGIDSDLDVAEADSLLETTLAQATALGIQRAQYEHAIALLVGQPASSFCLVPKPQRDKPPSIPVGLPAQLLERRPDIASAERAVAEANANIGVARAAYFPTVGLSGDVGLQSSTMVNLISASSFFWTAGGAATEVIFDAGKRKAANQQAWATFRANAATYKESVLTAFQQVEDNLAALRILDMEHGQQEVAVRAAQRNYDLALERYKQGIDSYLNVITAQVSLLSNQQTDVNIRLQQMTSAIQLVMDLGGGWNSTNLPSPHNVLHSSDTNYLQASSAH